MFDAVSKIFLEELKASEEYDVDAVLDDLNNTNENEITQNDEFIRRNLRIQPKNLVSKKQAAPTNAYDSDDSQES